jgi:hypothetical protein
LTKFNNTIYYAYKDGIFVEQQNEAIWKGYRLSSVLKKDEYTQVNDYRSFE